MEDNISRGSSSPRAPWKSTPIRYSSSDDSNSEYDVSQGEWQDEEENYLEISSDETNDSDTEFVREPSPSGIRNFDEYAEQEDEASAQLHWNSKPTNLQEEPGIREIIHQLQKTGGVIAKVPQQPYDISLSEAAAVVAFRLEKDQITDTQTLFVDSFAPWSTPGGCQQLQRFHDLSSGLDNLKTYRSKKALACSDSNEVLVVVSNRLTRNRNLQRKVFMIVDPRVYCSVSGTNYKSSLVSDVIVIYVWSGGTPPAEGQHGNAKGKEATTAEMADDLLRTAPPTAVARNLAIRTGDYIKRHQVVYRKRTATGVKLDRCGGTGREELSKLPSLAREFGWQMWSHQRPKKKKLDLDLVEVTDYVCMALSPVACAMFAAQAPTEAEIETLHNEVDAVLGRDDLAIDDYCQNRFDSNGLLKRQFGRGILFLDFTFDTNCRQLGTLSFLSNSFVRKNGGKPPLIDMAYVFIEKPDCESMFLVGSHISSFFAQHHPTARCSGFITDRELALKSLISETFPFFRRTKHLHCAIHMKENLKARLGQKTGEETFCRFFGNDRNRGLLDIVTEKTLFYLQFDSIVMEMIPGKPREWLRKQEEQLYDGGSLEVRLKAGLSYLSTTTNLSENRNKFLKSTLGRRLPLQDLLAKLFENHRGIMQILAVSVFGNETEFVLRQNRMAFGDGRRLSLDEKRSLAKEYGLEAVISTVEGPESFPPWMNDGRLGLSKKRFQEWVESIKITKSTFSPTRFFCDDTDFSGKSELPYVTFDGQSIQCSCRSGRWLICPHLAGFYLFGDQKHQVVSILRMRLELELPSERNCRLRTGNEGSKPYSKRRGSPLTAQNYVRPHERIRIPSRLVALRRYLKTHDLEPSDVQRSPESSPVVSSPSQSSQAIGSASQPVVSLLGPPHPQLPHGYRVVSQTMSPGPQVALPSATQTTRTASSASQPVVSLLGPPHPQLPHGYRVVSQKMSPVAQFPLPSANQKTLPGSHSVTDPI